MLAKTQDALTMQKNRKMFQIALTATNLASHTESALIAGFMQDALLFKLALSKVSIDMGRSQLTFSMQSG